MYVYILDMYIYIHIHIHITIFPATIPVNILMPGFVEDLICCPMGNLTYFD